MPLLKETRLVLPPLELCRGVNSDCKMMPVRSHYLPVGLLLVMAVYLCNFESQKDKKHNERGNKEAKRRKESLRVNLSSVGVAVVLYLRSNIPSSSVVS